MVRKNGIEKKTTLLQPIIRCQEIIKSNPFLSSQTVLTFKMYQQLNCKSYGLSYLLQCQIYHFQYVGKSKNLRFHNIEKVVMQKIAISAGKHFQTFNHEFQGDEQFALTEKIAYYDLLHCAKYANMHG